MHPTKKSETMTAKTKADVVRFFPDYLQASAKIKTIKLRHKKGRFPALFYA
jgi:hypothetical protein